MATTRGELLSAIAEDVLTIIGTAQTALVIVGFDDGETVLGGADRVRRDPHAAAAALAPAVRSMLLRVLRELDDTGGRVTVHV